MNDKTKELIDDFILIFIIFYFALDTQGAIRFSHTILGKLISISIILYYTQVKLVYGVLICAIILFFYQSDLVENTLNDKWKILESIESINDELKQMELDRRTPNISTPHQVGQNKNKPSANNVNNIQPYLKQDEYQLYSYQPSKPWNEKNEDILRTTDKKEQLKAIFRKQNCPDGVLEKKGEKVKKEMAEHVFREIKFDGEECNLCDARCDFSIIEEKLKGEEELLRPKHSNDWTAEMLSSIQNLLASPTEYSKYIPDWNVSSYI